MKGISASVFCSFDCLESNARPTALSVPSFVCTGLVTTRLPCISNVLPVVLTVVWHDSNFPAFVIFTDEEQATRQWIQGFHNQHLWADENQHVILPSLHQQWFSVYIWASTYSVNLFRSHILPNRLIRWNYKSFMEKNMRDFLTDMLLIILWELYLTHDGATTHLNVIAERYLIQNYPGHRMFRGGPAS
jgi:hypothetical protein